MSKMIVSGDCHLMEPGDLFTTRLPKHLRESAVAHVWDGEFMHLTVGGRRAISLSQYRQLNGDKLKDATLEERERHLEEDGVWGEVVHPNLGLFTFLPDHERAIAHARVYNDYLAEYFGGHFDRHKPAALIPLTDVAAAVAEIERAASLGLQVIMVPHWPPSSYATQTFDPVWAAAQANGMLVATHIGTGSNPETLGDRVDDSVSALRGDGAELALAKKVMADLRSPTLAQSMIVDLVCGGVMDRFPDLHLLMVEFNAYWLAALMGGMDKAFSIGIGQEVSAPVARLGVFDPSRSYDDQPGMGLMFGLNDKWPYELRPSDYIRRQVHCTIMDDPLAVELREFTGVGCLVWGSDYPHHEGTWPRSVDAIARQFADLPQADRDAIVGGTISSLLGFDPPEMAAAPVRPGAS